MSERSTVDGVAGASAPLRVVIADDESIIRMDLRGVGLSDPMDPSVPPSLEQWVGDALAVLDAAGSE